MVTGWTTRKEQRKLEAQQRQAWADARSPQEQLDRLDQILGKGVGAAKERTKLQKLIKNEGARKNKRLKKKARKRNRS